MHVVVFDLETRKLASDLPNKWVDLKAGKGGISALVIYDNISKRHHLYDDHNLALAAQHLELADVVLGFNSQEFDAPVIEGILGRRLEIQTHIDLLQLVWEGQTGRRKGNKLDDLARCTLGIGKPHDATLAPQLADDGRWAELFDYCIHDVELTKKLFEKAQKEGILVNGNGQTIPIKLPDWFSEVIL